ncbi:MAG: hypothetical protein IT245_01650, partial [Bacteroidia bacterium]|nr:hypothetical protein [Bacteroidia bacterium]
KTRLNENKKIALYFNTGIGVMTLKLKENFNNFMISTQNNINHFFSFQAGLGFGIPLDKSNDIQIRGEFFQGVTFSNIQATDIDIPRYSRGNYSFIQTRLGMSWRL